MPKRKNTPRDKINLEEDEAKFLEDIRKESNKAIRDYNKAIEYKKNIDDKVDKNDQKLEDEMYDEAEKMFEISKNMYEKIEEKCLKYKEPLNHDSIEIWRISATLGIYQCCVSIEPRRQPKNYTELKESLETINNLEYRLNKIGNDINKLNEKKYNFKSEIVMQDFDYINKSFTEQLNLWEREIKFSYTSTYFYNYGCYKLEQYKTNFHKIPKENLLCNLSFIGSMFEGSMRYYKKLPYYNQECYISEKINEIEKYIRFLKRSQLYDPNSDQKIDLKTSRNQISLCQKNKSIDTLITPNLSENDREELRCGLSVLDQT